MTVKLGETVAVTDNHTGEGDVGSWYEYVGSAPAVDIDLSEADFNDETMWKDLGNPVKSIGMGFVGTLMTYLNGNMGLTDTLVDSYSNAKVKGQKVATAGSGTVLILDHDATAVIEEGAQINQDEDGTLNDTHFRSGTQDVVVEALSVNHAVNLVGNFEFSLPKVGGGVSSAEGGSGAGASLGLYWYDNTVTAKIANDVDLYADSLEVDAENQELAVTMLLSGGQSDNFAFNGAFGANVVNNTTLAQIETGANIEVGSGGVSDADGGGASIFVDATDTSYVFAVSGGVASSKSVGVGGSLAVNVSVRDTAAVIGDEHGGLVADGSVTTSGDILVSAGNDGFIGSFAVAGASTSAGTSDDGGSDNAEDPGVTPFNGTGGTQGSDGSTKSDAALLNWQTRMGDVLKEMKESGKVTDNATAVKDSVDQVSKTTGNAKSGYAVSGAFTVNFIHDNAQASVRNIISVDAGNLSLDADDGTMIASLAGSVAFAKTQDDKTAVGVAGGVGINIVTGTTSAFVDGVDLTLCGLEMHADRTGSIVSLSAGAGGAKGKSGYGVGGSLAFSLSMNTTETALRTASGTVDGDILLEAHDDSNVVLIAGAGGFGGKAGVGAAIAFSDIKNTITSGFEHVTGLTHHGDVDIKALSDGMIISAVGAVGVGTGGGGEKGYGVAGTISVNLIDNLVDAFIVDSTTLAGSTGDISLLADDSAAIYSMAGGFAYGKTAGVGIAFALNLLDNEIVSRIEGSTLVTTGNLRTAAEEKGLLTTVCVGGAGAGKYAVAGSVAANVVSNSIDAHISASVDEDTGLVTASDIRVDGSVDVDATDRTSSVAVSGGLAFSNKGAVGAGIGANLIWNDVNAQIDSSYISAGTTLDVDASAEEVLVSVAIGGAGAEKFALGGAISVNDINNRVTAGITNSEGLPQTSADPDVTTASVSAGNDISLTAGDSSTMIVIAGGFAGSKDAAVGAAIGTTHVGNEITATIDNSAVESTAGSVSLLAGFEKPATDDGLSSLNSNLVGVALPTENSGQILNLTIGGAGSGKVAGGVGISVNVIDNDVEASIVNGATVDAAQDVTLAASDKAVIDALAFGGAGSGKVAGGGAIAANVITNDITTLVSDSTVTATAGDVVLESLSSALIRTLGMGVSGAGSVAVSASVLGNDITNHVTATIGGSTVFAGDDVRLTTGDQAPIALPGWMLTIEQQTAVDKALDDSPISLDANILALQVSVAGSGKVGVGVALMGNVITNTAHTRIDGSTVRAGVALDGTVLNSDGDVVLTTLSDSGIIALSVGVGAAGNVGVQASGFGNVITNHISSDIVGGSTVISGGLVDLTARDQSQIRALGLSIGASGSVAASVLIGANVITNSVATLISGSTVASGGALSLTAGNDADILSFTGGIAASGSVAVSTSLSGNVVANSTRAIIEGAGSDIDAGGAIALSATDTSTIDSLAFGVSGSSTGAVGVALSTNVITNTVETRISDADVDGKSTLDLTSNSSAGIHTLALGVSGSGAVAVQVTAMGNVVTNDVIALIRDSEVDTVGDVTLKARDDDPSVIPDWMVPADHSADFNDSLDGSPIDLDANILAVMISVAGSGTVAVNGAFSGNVITNDIVATIESSTVTSSAGDVVLDADSNAGIVALTVGVAGSGAVAVNATGFGNVIANSTQARIEEGAAVTTSLGGIALTADDSSLIRSAGVSVAATGGVSVGALIGANVITNAVISEISGSTVDSGATLNLAATNDADILGLTVGVAGSGGGAAMLSLSASVIDNTTRAAISATLDDDGNVVTRSDVDADEAITLTATDSSEINTLAVGVAGTGGVAGGAALAANVITNRIETEISDSEVDTDTSLALTSSSSAIIRTLAIGVSGSGGAAVQLTAMGNVIANDTSAMISGSTVTAADDITLAARDLAPSAVPFMTAIGSFIPDDDGDSSAEDTRSSRSKLSDALQGSPIDPNSNIVAVLVSVAGTGGVAVNGAFTGNIITNDVEAAIVDSTVTSTSGDIILDSDSSAGIMALTVGVAGSGAVAVNATGFGNDIGNNTQATIAEGSDVTSGGAIRLTADDSSQIRSLGVSVAGTGGIAVGFLAGANIIANDAVAEVSGSKVDSGSTLELMAENSAAILGFTAGVAGAGGGAGMMSLSGNVVSNTTRAAIKSDEDGRSDIDSDGAITLSAKDTSSIDTLAFGVAGSGGGAVGLAAAANVIDNSVETLVSGTDLDTDAGLSLFSESSASIRALAFGISGSGGFAAQLTVLGNAITNDVSSMISGSVVHAVGDVKLTALEVEPGGGAFLTAIDALIPDDPDSSDKSVKEELTDSLKECPFDLTANIVSVNIGIAGAGGLAANAVVSGNVITNSTEALITEASVTSSAGAIDLAGDSKAGIVAVNAGVGIAGGVALNASITKNEIANTISAGVSGGAVLSAAGDITLDAIDNSRIDSLGLSLAGAISTAIGGAFAFNSVNNEASAFIDGTSPGAPAQVVKAGHLTLNAHSTSKINALSMGASVGAVAAGSTQAHSEVGGTVEAYIGSSAEVGMGTASVGAITLSGVSDAEVHSDVMAVSAGIGAGSFNWAKAEVDPTVQAYIGDAAVRVDGDVTVNAESNVSAVADSKGVNAGLAAVGVSKTETTLNSTVEASVGGTLSAGGLSVRATQGAFNTEHAAQASASGSAGALVGVDATISTVTNTNSTRSYIEDNATLTVSGDMVVAATAETRQKATADSNVVGIVAAGITAATASSDTTTTAYIGANSDIAAGNLAVLATAEDDNDAEASPGSGGVVAAASARPQTINTSETTATIKGDTVIDLTGAGSGELDVKASHCAIFATRVLTEAYGALAGSGADADSTIDATVLAAVENYTAGAGKTVADIRAKDIDLLATNRIDGDNYIKGSTGGVVSGAGVDSDTLIDLDTQVKVGENAWLEVVGVASNDHTFSLEALNILNVTDQVIFTTGGALSGAGADLTIKTTQDLARVTVGNGATLHAAGAMDISARGQGDVHGLVSVETYGAGTVAVGTTRVELHPDNQIDINGDAELLAFGDLSLSTGRSSDPNMITASDSYTVEARWDGFAGSAIPISDIDAKAFIIQQNAIDVAAGAILKTGRQANLYADREGLVNLTGKAKAVSWVSEAGDGLNSVLGGGGDEQFEGKELAESHGVVTVDGTIQTGLTRHQSLVLSGWDAVAGTVDATSDLGLTFTTDFKNIENGLVQELNDAEQVLAEFGHTNATLKSFYEGEIARIKAELDASGLGEQVTAPDGTVSTIYPKKNVLTVTVNPIWAQAGVIDVRSDQLQGSGDFIAPGDTSVEIINNTPAFIELLGITIPDVNGGLFLNGVLIEDNDQIGDVNSINADDDNAQGFSGVDPTVEVGEAGFDLPETGGENTPTITVRNDLDVAGVIPPNGGSYPWPDITVLGPDDGGLGIYNDGGTVTLQTLPSGKGSIRIEGTVRAANLNVIAGGDVFVTGVSSYPVGGEPAGLLGNEPGGTTGTYGAGWATAAGVKPASDTAVTNVANDPQSQPYSMYGDRIHIDAEYININGIMQSGRDSYVLDIDDAAYAEARAEMAQGKSGPIYLKETSAANPGFSVYFNSATQQFEVSELKTSGGYIELFGNILNTGTGEIRLLGGYASVEINNTTDFDLVVNRLDVSQRGKGTLIIQDKANGAPVVSGIDADTTDSYTSLYQWTEDGVLLTTNGSSNPSHTGTETIIGYSSSYQPNELLRYGWTTVVEQNKIKKEYTKSGSWLGAVPDIFQDADFEWDSIEVQGTPHYSGSGPYYYFATEGSAEADADYTYNQKTVTMSESDIIRYWHDDYWTWYGSHVYEAKYKQIEGQEVRHTHTLNAHRPVAINFIGEDEGRVTINATGDGDVELHGAILNQQGVTSVTSGGAIESLGDSAYITGRQITLNASGDIGSNAQAVAINLTDSGAPYAGLVAQSLKGDIAIHELRGDLRVQSVEATGGGDVSLTADGAISVARATEHSWHAGVVAGGSIQLTAEGGGIGHGDGSTAPPLVINSGLLPAGAKATLVPGSVSATAAGDIYLQELDGDLWVDQIMTTGNVWIGVVNGDLLDANTMQERDERTYNELKEGVWADLQLTGDSGAQEKIDATLDSYRSIKQQEYRSYWTYRSQQPDSAAYDGDFQVSLSESEEAYYRSELGYDDAAISTLENKRTAEYHTLHKQFAAYFDGQGSAFPDSYDSGFVYVLSTTETDTLTGSIKVWTEEELLSLIGGGLLKSVTDTQVIIEDANIVAEDVTLLVDGQIGRTAEPTLIELDGHTFTSDERVAMAAAERADVTYLSADAVEARVSFDGAANTMTRTDGSPWSGFSAGMAVTVTGNTANGTEGLSYHRVESVDGAVITFGGNTQLVSESGRDVSVSAIVLDPTFASLATTDVAVTFADNGYNSTGRVGDTITRSDGGSWLADGFVAGSLVKIDGISVNATGVGEYYRVADVSASVLTLSGRDKLVSEGDDVTVTIERGESPYIKAIRIDHHDDLNLNTRGAVTATTGGDIFVGSAPVAGSERLLQVNRIQAGTSGDPGSIRLKVGAGISNAAPAGTINITGGDLLLEAGDGGIGSDAAPLITDLFGTSTLTARATQGIYLQEHNAGNTAGSMYIESVYSESGIAHLVADGSIVDALNTDFTKIKAVSIVLEAGGAIGEAGLSPDYLELDMAQSGTVKATANGSVWLAETFNDMNIDSVLSRTGDVDLKAHQSIIDAVDDGSGLSSRPEVDISGNNIILTSEYGGLGVSGNDVDIDSAHSAAGTLTSSSALNTYLIERTGDLLLNTISTGGYGSGYTAFIATPQGSIKNGRTSGSNILSGKTYLFASQDIGEQTKALTTEVGNIEGQSTAGSIWVVNTGAMAVGGVTDTGGPSLLAGGRVELTTMSPLTITENIVATSIALSAVDTGSGDHLTVRDNASLTSTGGDVTLNAGDDLIVEHLGRVTSQTGTVYLNGDVGNSDDEGSTMRIHGFISGMNGIVITAGSDNDRILFSPESFIGDTSIYGGTGDDELIVDQLPTNTNRLDVDGQAGTDNYTINITGVSDYIINVHDSGAADDGSDRLEINGTAADDTFLMRKNFVAGLHGSKETGFSAEVERINYDESINARLRINGLDGADSFYVDDNSTLTTLSGGLGNDRFQIGQMFGSERGVPYVAAGDEIVTTETTLGFLSNGISQSMVVYGGLGNDQLKVYSNKASLKLYGEEGNDEFVVRAFLEKGTNNVAGGGDTDLFGGDGDDSVFYTINAPVGIDGGSGNDKVVVIGTEADDHFVLTADGIYGAGLNVSFNHVEEAEVDGLEGDDNFYILSTGEEVVTTVIGGLGSDSFHVGGDVTGQIVSSSTNGVSSFINHSASSDDPLYNGIFVDGVSLNVANAKNTSLLMSATEVVLDDSHEGQYSLQMLAELPDVATLAFLTVSATRPSQGDNRGKVLVSTNGVDYFESLVLTFDSTGNWSDERTIYVRVTADVAANEEHTIMINHGMQSANPDFHGLNMPGVELYSPDSGHGAPDVPPSDSLVEIEWLSESTQVSPGKTGRYAISLRQEPSAEVTIALLNDGQTLLSSSAANFDPAAWTVTFNADNWDQPVEIMVDVDTDAESGNDLVQQFPIQPHDLTQIRGELIIEGSIPEGRDRSLVTAVTLPSETDEALVGIDVDIDEALQTDHLNIFNDGTVAAAVGGLDATRITGLGMGAAITYHDVEAVDVMLGRGDDTFTVTDTAEGTLTRVHGGGGSDHLIASGGGGADAPLILLGDTTQDGHPYDSTSAEITGGAREYIHAGDDVIDARGAAKSVIIYGGAGNDTIWGSQGDDHIAGGSGNDVIHGQGGSDHIYGDSGFNIDVSTRLSLAGQILTVVNTPSAGDNPEIRDDLMAGADTLDGDGGSDILFGDYGVIGQTPGTQRILSTGGVVGVDTVNLALGADDHLSGGSGNDLLLGGQGADRIDGGAGDNRIFGDNGRVRFTSGVLTELQSTDTTAESTGDDLITAGDGANLVVAGGGNDRVVCGVGDDLILGDNGQIAFTGAGVLARIESYQNFGGDDVVDGGAGDNVAIGGFGDDVMKTGAGDDILVGDNGFVDYDAKGLLERARATAPDLGGDDWLGGGGGNDILIGGAKDDRLFGGDGDDSLMGDGGMVTFQGGRPQFVETVDFFKGGNDYLSGGSGEDILLGSAGHDFFDGNMSDDIIIGEYGRTTIKPDGKVESTVRFAQGNLDLLASTQFELYRNEKREVAATDMGAQASFDSAGWDFQPFSAMGDSRGDSHGSGMTSSSTTVQKTRSGNHASQPVAESKRKTPLKDQHGVFHDYSGMPFDEAFTAARADGLELGDYFIWNGHIYDAGLDSESGGKVLEPGSFAEAFARARENCDGEECTFIWKGKVYRTILEVEPEKFEGDMNTGKSEDDEQGEQGMDLKELDAMRLDETAGIVAAGSMGWGLFSSVSAKKERHLRDDALKTLDRKMKARRYTKWS
ncbi:hypothetical protein DSLASN_18110 [Desulfoluna limicola]|uniref:Uncharacterized protein n=1 Tax=Desulfoluna limicola TaxID=2810562 RepID=A0ABM7PGF2_9BACT|nr:hypothetical protein DSLASN_18110 [Desulfoluna limicola]